MALLPYTTHPCRTAAAALAPLAAALLAAAGCVAGASSKGMTVAPTSITASASPAPHGAVAVREIRGGKATSRFLVSRIGGDDFEAALLDSLREAGLLAPSAAEARYALEAEIVEAQIDTHDRPFRNLQQDETVVSTVHYLLTDVETGSTVLDRRIEVSYTAANGTAFLAARRTRLAHEGSARESIETLIDELCRLRIDAAAAPAE